MLSQRIHIDRPVGKASSQNSVSSYSAGIVVKVFQLSNGSDQQNDVGM